MWKRAFPFKICPNTIAMFHMDKPMMKMGKNALQGSPGQATEINYTNATPLQNGSKYKKVVFKQDMVYMNLEGNWSLATPLTGLGCA